MTPPAATGDSSSKGSHWLKALLLVLATLAAYHPAWNGDFLWDDDAWTTRLHALFKDGAGLGRIWAGTPELQQYYPVTATTFWIDHQLWKGWSLPYHLENILIHAGSALLLWRILIRLEVSGAWLAAAIFALHPVMVESVAWITERKNLLSMLLFLAGLWAYGRAVSFWSEDCLPKWRPWVAAFVLFLLAMLAKITVVVLPPVILLIHWWKLGTIRWRRTVLPLVPFFAAAVVLGLYIMSIETHHVGAKGPEWEIAWADRCIIAGRAWWFYWALLLWPSDLCFIYPEWTLDASSVFSWLPLLAAVLAIGAVWQLRGRIGRGVSVAVFYYTGTVLPVLGFLNVYGMRFSYAWDHWIYLSSPAVFILASVALVRLSRFSRHQWIQTTASVLLLAVLGTLSWKQSHLYKNSETLWRVTLEKNPDCWIASNNLGVLLFARGDFPEAVGWFQRAVALKPRRGEAFYNLGNTQYKLGRYEDTVATLKTAIELEPATPEALGTLGFALLHVGRDTDALALLDLAQKSAPEDAEISFNLGVALIQLGRLDEAAQHIERALVARPQMAEAHLNLGNIHFQKGEWDLATAQFEAALNARPGYAEAHHNLGNTLARTGKHSEAVAEMRRALELNPSYAEAHFNLANLLQQQSDLVGARRHFEEAVKHNPSTSEAHNNFGNLLIQTGEISAAIEHFREALRLNSRLPMALTNLGWVLATCPDDSLRNGGEATELALRALELEGRDPFVPMVLAAAHGETGRFEDALRIADQALNLALQQGNQGLAQMIRAHMEAYRAGTAIRDRSLVPRPSSP